MTAAPRPDQHTSTGQESRVTEHVVGRRRFLSYLIGAPLLAVATPIGIGTAAADSAAAAIPSPPSVEEAFDIADAIILAGQPTMGLITLAVEADGTVRLELPRLEMGQGITTAVAMLIAEELDLGLDSVSVSCADARPELLFNQMTAGSCTLRAFYDPVRVLAATARGRMLAAAARQWGVPAAELSVEEGRVHAPDGRTLAYGELSAAAADPSLTDIAMSPKPESEHTLVGRPTPRADALDIVTGRKRFTMDLQVPGALPAMVRRAPTINGEFRSVANSAEIEAMPGVEAVVPIPTGVAVVARTFEQARAAVCRVDATFSDGPVAGESNETIQEKLRAAVLPFVAPPLGAVTVESEFAWHSAAHVPLETEAAVADVRDDGADVWSGFQAPIVAQQKIAEELGMAPGSVTAHVVPPGGGFGRRVFFDGALEAAQISQRAGLPVRLMWHRTDDLRHGRCRPANFHRFRATLVADQVTTFEQRVAGVSTDYRHGLGEVLTATATSLPEGARQAVANDAFGQAVFLTMVSSPYEFGVYDKLQVELPLGMATSSYRSVPCQTARGSEEMVVDEIAEKLGKDPYEFRRSVLSSDRARAVLDRAAEVGDWGRSMAPGTAQGIGYHEESRALTASVVELDASDPSAPQVTRVVLVIDVGRVVNPLGVEAQMQGCIAEAISLTLRAGLHVVDGLPLEGSYSQYHFARQRDYPADVQVVVLPSNGERMGGTGEVGMAAPTGAIGNAYTRATGTRPRSFPINHPVDFDPIPPGQLPPPAFPEG